MAKFIKVEKQTFDGHKYVVFINIENITTICSEGQSTRISFVGNDDFVRLDMPISEFMDLVNSAK